MRVYAPTLFGLAAMFLHDTSAVQACGDKFLLWAAASCFIERTLRRTPHRLWSTPNRNVTRQTRFGIPGFSQS